MAHYIEYWSPDRAALAFNGQNSAVYEILGSRFRRLHPGDIVWLLTREGEQVYLVLRFEVNRVLKPSRSPFATPPHAIASFWQVARQHRIAAVPETAGPPRAIPVPLKEIRKLRFDSTVASDRITESGSRIFERELATMRRLKDGTEQTLEELWAAHPRSLWVGSDVESDGSSRGGFASPETRAKVEKAAVRHVVEWFESRGWTVRSREKDGVGYDLECTKGGQRQCVEVKGTSGNAELFMLTRGEYSQARDNPDFRLAIVTNALNEPKAKFVTGEKLLAKYRFEPLQYMVTPRK